MSVDKIKKHYKLLSEKLKDKTSEDAVFDGYVVHEELLNWAIENISTKKLKKIIERS